MSLRINLIVNASHFFNTLQVRDLLIKQIFILMKTDLEIQKDVMDELKWEPVLSASQIGVAVKNGVVMLSGDVNSYGKKYIAEKATWRVKGVKAVAEDLEVTLSTDDRLTDTEIATNVLNALKYQSLVPNDRLKVKVSDGWLTLEGHVDWNYQKESGLAAVRNLKGIKGIHNFVTVKPTVNTLLVKENIKKALERRADIDAANIHVEAVGNKLILTGTARSWQERRAAENAAWATPGVGLVEDNLIIA